MTTYPPYPLKWQNRLALDYSHSQVAYVGYEGTIFHIDGPFAPVMGAQTGAVVTDWSHLDPPFKMLDNKGARQDGTTWYDTLYDPCEIDFNVTLGGANPSDMRALIASWFGAWDPKKLGKLCWFSPERGEWFANVRMGKAIGNKFDRDWYTSGKVSFTWNCRNDNAFWQGVDSVGTFTTNSTQIISIGGTSSSTSGFFNLIFGGFTTVELLFNSGVAEIQSALEALSSVGTGNVSVSSDASGTQFVVEFINALGGVGQELLGFVSNIVDGVLQIFAGSPGSSTLATGYVPLTNIGDQPAWPRYLVYGPGTFTIGDGLSGNSVTFGPLLENQIALLTTLPRLQSVTDLSPVQAPIVGSATDTLITTLIDFVTNNNIPPLLEEFLSVFGILPPQNAPLYSLLNGRFVTPLDPMLTQIGPQTAYIPCSISGGNAASKIIGAVTPLRRWPE